MAGFLGIFLLCLFVLLPAVRVRAASDFNLLEAVDRKTPKTGTWQITEQGRRFVYSNGKYPRKVWLKLDGKYYYFDTNGLRQDEMGKVLRETAIFFPAEAPGMVSSFWGSRKSTEKPTSFPEDPASFSAAGQRSIKNGTISKRPELWIRSTWIDGRYLQKKRLRDGGNTTVDGKYVGEDGYVARIPRCLCLIVGYGGKNRDLCGRFQDGWYGQTAGQGETYIAKTGEGYEWFSTTGLKRLRKALQKDPDAAVVINLGINDLGNIGHYIKLYNRLFRSYPQADFYLMSVNPIEQKKSRFRGVYGTNQRDYGV